MQLSARLLTDHVQNTGKARRVLSLVIVVCASVTANAEPIFPSFDIDKTCRDQSNYAFAATLGQADKDHEFTACSAHERTMRDQAQAAWAEVAVADRLECTKLAEDRYNRLAICLDDIRRKAARR